jgi:hypothetical protein
MDMRERKKNENFPKGPSILNKERERKRLDELDDVQEELGSLQSIEVEVVGLAPTHEPPLPGLKTWYKSKRLRKRPRHPP